ncbi:MAG: type II restriction enzyme [Ktedonobacteraceae bacterium]
MVKKPKNDVAWEQLFNKYSILDKVSQEGQFVIGSAQINKFRESRLMTKFDQSINLPQMFRDNNLSILPVSRSKYVIAPFATHRKVEYDSEIEIKEAHLPSNIESINYTDLYSEAVALNCAFNSGIINDVVGENTFHTISGRMSTENFAFSINSSILSQPPHLITVNNSQCEIDGGFEGDSRFAIIEVKNYAVEDFLIRQLYYPYRLWAGKLSKQIVPILMTFSQDIFDFFVYEFDTETLYNSLRLVQRKRYAIAPEEITREEISHLISQIHLVPEPQGIPFPQADRFDRVVDLLSLLTVKDLSRDEITESFEFDARQTNYYTDAARYLGLVEKFTDPDTREITFTLTEEARQLFSKRPKQKYLGLIRNILEHIVYYKAFQATQWGEIPAEEEISKIIVESQINISGATVGRRAITVRGWIKWIWDQMD